MDKTSAAHRYQLAHWADDREPALRGTAAFLIIALCLTVALRFWAQRKIEKQWAPDNIVILFAAILDMGVTAACLVAFGHGAGKHLARVVATDPQKPNQLIKIFKAGYVIGVLQGPCLGLIKFSILLFYRRIFTMHRRTFKIAFFVLGTYTLLLTIATTIVFILQCLPITFFWDRSYLLERVKPPHPVKGHCLPQQLHVVSTLIANTISDIALLVLPAIGLWKLQLPRIKKMGLFAIFSLAAFVVFVGAVRIYFGYKATNSTDISWLNADIMIWTAVECCIGTICASLPTLGPLLKRPGKSSSLPSMLWNKTWSFLKSWSFRSHPSRSQSHTQAGPFDQDGNCSLQALQPVYKKQHMSTRDV